MGLARLEYYKLHSEVNDPKFATKGSACFDLYACLIDDSILKTATGCVSVKGGEFWVAEGERILIPTGLILNIPSGYSVRIHPRSGISFNRGLSLANCEGVIDHDYVEEVFVSIINNSSETQMVGHNERIAQAELVRNKHYQVKETKIRPGRTTRDGGFGSTGKR